VPDSKALKFLLVEDSPDDEQLLTEALLEIEENRLWPNGRSASVLPIDRLTDALDCLRRDTFDAILLNLSLPDSPALLDSYLDVSACVSNAPIVVLADEPDESLANRLLREGAQEVLVKSEIECVPLARSIRHAMERQRRVVAARASAFTDHLTGVLTRDAFLTAANHFVQLPLQLLGAVIEISSANREARELLLIDTADALCDVFGPPSLVGRWDRCRFSVLSAGLTEPTVEALLRHVAAKLPAGILRVSRSNPHELLNLLDEPTVGESPLLAKTAMLSD
jgi:DNA-binding NarL/FixJ family response regulator